VMAETHRQPRCALYRHFDGDGRLLYVGISLNALSRLAQHCDSSHWVKDISTVRMEWFVDRESALLAERKAIAQENPAHNLRRPGVRVHRFVESGLAEDSVGDLVHRIVRFNTTYSVNEVAKELGVGPTEVRRLMEKGMLGFVEIGEKKLRRVTGWQLIAFLEFEEDRLGPDAQ
jgi:excisionase family DNA binding protein